MKSSYAEASQRKGTETSFHSFAGSFKENNATLDRMHHAKSYRPFELFVNENYKL